MTTPSIPPARALALMLAFTLVVSLSLACASPPASTPTQAPPPPTAAKAPPPTVAATPEAKPPQSAPAAATPTSAPAPPKPSTELPPKPAVAVTVKTGLLGLISDAGLYLAQDKGYFKDQGLDAVFEKFDTGPQMLPPLATEQLDVATFTPDVALFNAVARGLSLKIVADKGSMPPGFGFNAFVVRTDLAGSIKDYKDLKGRAIARLQSTTQEIAIDKALKKGGLTLSDVNLVPLSVPDMIAALANKSIDVALVIEPFAAIAEARGVGKIWKTVDEVYPNQQIALIAYSPQFGARKDGAPQRWMVAYLKGVRDYYDAFVKNKGKDEVVKSLIQNTAVKDAPLYDKMIPAGLNPDGYVNTKGIADDQDWWYEKGDLKEKIDVSKLVDNSFVDYALSVLGKYQK